MSAVVLRCPNCGTTQAVGGECEACHEADVRWYCPNHTPGRWLDTPTCAECAVRESRARDESAARDRAARAREEAERYDLERLARAARERAARRAEAGRTPRVSRAEPRRPSPSVFELPTYPAPRTPEPMPIEVPPLARGPSVSLRLPSVTGCVGGAVMLVLRLVIALVVIAMIAMMFFGGSMQRWFVDLGQQFGVVAGTSDLTRRGIELYNAGDREQAERVLEEAAQTYRRDALPLLYLARSRMEAGDLERAAQHLDEAERREPESPQVHKQLGDYYTLRARQAQTRGLNPAIVAAEEEEARRHYARAR
jgi:tetratricopeptide (TPR) repeat protein